MLVAVVARGLGLREILRAHGGDADAVGPLQLLPLTLLDSVLLGQPAAAEHVDVTHGAHL